MIPLTSGLVASEPVVCVERHPRRETYYVNEEAIRLAIVPMPERIGAAAERLDRLGQALDLDDPARAVEAAGERIDRPCSPRGFAGGAEPGSTSRH